MCSAHSTVVFCELLAEMMANASRVARVYLVPLGGGGGGGGVSSSSVVPTASFR